MLSCAGYGLCCSGLCSFNIQRLIFFLDMMSFLILKDAPEVECHVFSSTDTPWTIHMEPKHGDLEDDLFAFSIGCFLCSMLIFRGVQRLPACITINTRLNQQLRCRHCSYWTCSKAMFIDAFPQKLTCPLKRDRFKRACHLNQPFMFQGHVRFFERVISIAMLDSGSVGDWQSSFPTKTFMIELTQSFGWSKNSIVYTIVRGWLHHFKRYFKVHPDGLWRSHNNLNHKNGSDLLAIYVARIFTPKKTWCPSRIFILKFFQAFALEEYSNCEKVCNFIVVQVFFGLEDYFPFGFWPIFQARTVFWYYYIVLLMKPDLLGKDHLIPSICCWWNNWQNLKVFASEIHLREACCANCGAKC